MGGLMSLAAIFANQLGIDNDTGWGSGRMLLLRIGVASMGLGAILHIFQNIIRKIQIQIYNFLDSIGRERLIHISFFTTTIFMVLTYNWILRDEADAVRIYNYYSELAKGFRKGNLYLSEMPSTTLLSLSNPYDPVLRKQESVEDFPWDVTLYDGKFYIYWGPTPAILLMPLNDEILSGIEDLHLAAFYAVGLFIYSALIVTSFWRHSKNAPIWALFVALLVLACSVPVTTMLKKGEVYEAAIFACQFFFIGGCYWAYSSFLDETPSIWKYLLAGIHWVFAIGARVTILPTVAVSMLILISPILTGFAADWKNRLKPILAAGFPILVGGVALAWYNYARFGDIFEFGVRYQLANVDYTQFESSFGFHYFTGNLKVYFLHPIQLGSRFPFLSLIEYTASNDRLAGLLYIAPFILLFPLPFFHVIARKNGTSAMDSRIFYLFAGAAVVSSFIIFTFYFITLRYTLDFLPAALILIIFSVAKEYDGFHDKPLAAGIFSLIFIIPALANIMAGMILAIPQSGIAFMLNFLNAVSKALGFR